MLATPLLAQRGSRCLYPAYVSDSSHDGHSLVATLEGLHLTNSRTPNSAPSFSRLHVFTVTQSRPPQR